MERLYDSYPTGGDRWAPRFASVVRIQATSTSLSPKMRGEISRHYSWRSSQAFHNGILPLHIVDEMVIKNRSEDQPFGEVDHDKLIMGLMFYSGHGPSYESMVKSLLGTTLYKYYRRSQNAPEEAYELPLEIGSRTAQRIADTLLGNI